MKQTFFPLLFSLALLVLLGCSKEQVEIRSMEQFVDTHTEQALMSRLGLGATPPDFVAVSKFFMFASSL